MKVLHVLYQSFPNVSGSSTRSYDIVDSQRVNGLVPIVVTSPFQKGLSPNKLVETINGCKYYRTYNDNEDLEVSEKGNSLFKRVYKFFQIFSFYRKLKKIVEKEKVDVIHAHAMFFCAIPAVIIGKKLNVPVVYEIRSLWEERNKEKFKGSMSARLQYRVIRIIESYSMKKSSAVVVINKGLQENLIDRGIDEEKITIVQNGVNIKFIENQKLKFTKSTNPEYLNIGYIGSLSPIEGLDNLINIVIKMNQKATHSKKIRLLIYGSGVYKEILVRIAKNDENIQFKGSLKREDIYKAYEEIDVIVNPRIKSKLTDSVTPLKPLEAMCFEKPVIASNVGGMKELIDHNVTGFLFDAERPAEINQLLNSFVGLSEKKLEKVVSEALEYVKNERSWDSNALIYKKLYSGLLVGEK